MRHTIALQTKTIKKSIKDLEFGKRPKKIVDPVKDVRFRSRHRKLIGRVKM